MVSMWSRIKNAFSSQSARPERCRYSPEDGLLSVEVDASDPATAEWIDNWKPFEPQASLPDYEARLAVTQSGLCQGRDEDLNFIRNAIAQQMELRKAGTRLKADELRSLGLRGNVALTHEFLAILTEKGRTDPLDASYHILRAYSSRLAALNSIGSARHAGITEVQIYPNNMAAGPCSACLELSKEVRPIVDAPLGPLPECPHPTQCALIFRSVVDIEGIDNDGNPTSEA